MDTDSISRVNPFEDVQRDVFWASGYEVRFPRLTASRNKAVSSAIEAHIGMFVLQPVAPAFETGPPISDGLDSQGEVLRNILAYSLQHSDKEPRGMSFCNATKSPQSMAIPTLRKGVFGPWRNSGSPVSWV